MGKNLDKLGTIEDYKAPWETETGADTEIDSGKLKKFLFGLLTDKAKAEDAAEEHAAKVTIAEKALTDAQAEFGKGDTTGALSKAQADLATAVAERDAAAGDLLRITVGIDKGLTPAQAKRLQGKTKEELETDADEILETFGVAKASPKDDDEDPNEADAGRLTPRKLSLVNPGDEPGGAGGKEFDYEAEAAKIVGGSFI